MKYKYRKNQLFGRKLNVPSEILEKIYTNNISFEEFIKYDLIDKIPLSCIRSKDFKIVEKFGLEKAKTLDWELINKYPICLDLLKTLTKDEKDINYILYEKIKDKIPPTAYSSKMKNIYKDRLFIDLTDQKDGKLKFNNGTLSLKDIIANWELYKDKDLTYCLIHDKNNTHHITNDQVKAFMNNYKTLINLTKDSTNIYEFIDKTMNSQTEEEKKKYLQALADNLLIEISGQLVMGTGTPLTNKQYKDLFRYSSFKVKDFFSNCSTLIKQELNNLEEDYILNSNIPFNLLISDNNILNFIDRCGFQQIIEFDKKNNNFFTKNNCQMLKAMDNLTTHLSVEPLSEEGPLFKGVSNKEPYTKEEFAELLRRTLKYTNSSISEVADILLNFKELKGEFREQNEDYFISQNAPEELQKVFYKKEITPKILKENPEYLKYLKGKSLERCFKMIDINILDNRKNLYSVIKNMASYDDIMHFLSDYSDIFSILTDDNNNILAKGFTKEDIKINKLNLTNSSNLNELMTKLDDIFYKYLTFFPKEYPTNLPEHFKNNYPNTFLSANASEELKKSFYSRTINWDEVIANPKYQNYLKSIDPEILFKHIPVLDETTQKYVNLISLMKNYFKESTFQTILSYGNHLEKIANFTTLKLNIDKNLPSKAILNTLDESIYKAIIDGRITYNDNIRKEFREKHSMLFLDTKVPDDIKEKFYNRQFEFNDFATNLSLVDMIGEANIICGLDQKLSWLIPLFAKDKNQKKANYSRLKVLENYLNLKDNSLKEEFKNYIINTNYNIDVNKIDYIAEVLNKLSKTNSQELYNYRTNFARLILKTKNPIASLDKIENVFIRNNIPMFSKIFKCFRILYPDLSQKLTDGTFDFSPDSTMSPELIKASPNNKVMQKLSRELKNKTNMRFQIIYNDLLRIAIYSNNRSLKNYLANIEEGNNIYLSLINNNLKLEDLSIQDKNTLKTFTAHLKALFENINPLEDDTQEQNLSDLDLKEQITYFREKFKVTNRYDLPDRIVRHFAYFLGIKSFNELKNLMEDNVYKTNKKNYLKAEKMRHKKTIPAEGDFLRCIGTIEAFGSSLDEGNLCNEYLGPITGKSTSDTTELDADFTKVSKAKTVYDAINGTPTGWGFGNIFFVLEKDNPRISITRDEAIKDGVPYDPKKIEMFCSETIKGGFTSHWGARTGIASSDIDYIIYKKNKQIDPNKPYKEDGSVNYLESDSKDNDLDDLAALKVEIVKKGFYIPVIDLSGNLIFTPEEYEKIASHMAGLSYYDKEKYTLDDTIYFDKLEDILLEMDEDNKKQKHNQNVIETIIKEILALEFNHIPNLKIEPTITNDLSSNILELIPTGSTSRGTNVLNDADYDYMLKIGKNELAKHEHTLLDKFKKILNPKDNLSHDNRFRGMNIKVDSIEADFDLDISLAQKRSNVEYSSEMALNDRLNSIKKQYPKEYSLVIANIIYAKKLLKEANAYKSKNSSSSEGGLSGIGVENWILQNGGSFTKSCQEFLKYALESDGNIKPFSEFKKDYKIWDFGENHECRQYNDITYNYDEFVSNNMNETGYYKMIDVLKKHLDYYKKQKHNKIK